MERIIQDTIKTLKEARRRDAEMKNIPGPGSVPSATPYTEMGAEKAWDDSVAMGPDVWSRQRRRRMATGRNEFVGRLQRGWNAARRLSYHRSFQRAATVAAVAAALIGAGAWAYRARRR